MGADFALVARLLATPTRSTMIGALLDGRPRSAGELARLSAVKASTASEHLADLVNGGLVCVRVEGRHRYFTIASPEVAQALEALSQICPPAEVRSLRLSAEMRALRYARTCYDHLAGVLGVALLEGLVSAHWLSADNDAIAVSAHGKARFDDLGIDVAALRNQRRSFARPCLDWTERTPHLAGSLAAALTTVMLERGWVERNERRRGLSITAAGKRCLPIHLDLTIPPVDVTYGDAARIAS
jgi:DNA-binding transcriptional ArsR family regulator